MSTGEKIPYNKIPVFTMHSDGNSDDKHFIAEDASGKSFDVDFTNVSNGVLTINSTEYYTKAKVDELLQALESRVKAYADAQDDKVKQWANGQFKLKGEA